MGCRPAIAKVAAGLLVLGGMLHLVVALATAWTSSEHGCDFFDRLRLSEVFAISQVPS